MPFNKLRYGRIDAIESLRPGCLQRNIFRTDIEPYPLDNLRHIRNQLLAESDWMANSDVTMSDAWKTYRQELRDLPANTSDPSNPTWPSKPS